MMCVPGNLGVKNFDLKFVKEVNNVLNALGSKNCLEISYGNISLTITTFLSLRNKLNSLTLRMIKIVFPRT